MANSYSRFSLRSVPLFGTLRRLARYDPEGVGNSCQEEWPNARQLTDEKQLVDV